MTSEQCAVTVFILVRVFAHEQYYVTHIHSLKPTAQARGHITQVFLLLLLFTFYNCIVPMGNLLWEIQVTFPEENQL